MIMMQKAARKFWDGPWLPGDGVEGINRKFRSKHMVNIKTQRAAEMLVQLIVAPILFVRLSSTFRNFIFVLNWLSFFFLNPFSVQSES